MQTRQHPINALRMARRSTGTHTHTHTYTHDPKQAADTERGPAGDPQPPAQGRAAGTQQTGLVVSFRVKIQGPPVLHFPVCNTSLPLPFSTALVLTRTHGQRWWCATAALVQLASAEETLWVQHLSQQCK